MKVFRYPNKPLRFTPTTWVVKKAMIARPAVTDSVVVLDLTVKNEGDYVLSVTASDLAGVSAAIDGEAVPLDAAGRSQPIEEWGGGSDAVITITVPAGVTVSHIGYAKG